MVANARQAALQMNIDVRPCNCIGPQAGETKCPCMLVVEMRQAETMLAEGVVISGRKYRLVPDEGNQL